MGEDFKTGENKPTQAKEFQSCLLLIYYDTFIKAIIIISMRAYLQSHTRIIRSEQSMSP